MANQLAGWIQTWKENDLKTGDKKIWERDRPLWKGKKIWNYVCPCCLVTKSWLTLLQPHGLQPTDSSVHEISQAWILECIASSFSRSSWPWDQIHISHFAGGFFTDEPSRKPECPVWIFTKGWPQQKWNEMVSCLVMSDSLWPHGLQHDKLLFLWNSPGKTRVGCHSLLQEIFPMQRLNLCLLHCR